MSDASAGLTHFGPSAFVRPLLEARCRSSLRQAWSDNPAASHGSAASCSPSRCSTAQAAQFPYVRLRPTLQNPIKNTARKRSRWARCSSTRLVSSLPLQIHLASFESLVRMFAAEQYPIEDDARSVEAPVDRALRQFLLCHGAQLRSKARIDPVPIPDSATG